MDEIQKYPSKLRIISGGPWELKKPPFEISHTDPSGNEALLLKEKYSLETVAADAKSEMGKFILLMEWVNRTMVRHGWTFNYLKPIPSDALGILGKVAEGVLFNCGYHAIVLTQCLEALGYPARVTGVMMTGVEFPGKRYGNIGHAITEVWCNELVRWVLLDSDSNLYYEKDGMPLSVSEMCVEWNNNRCADVKPIYGERKQEFDTCTNNQGLVLGLESAGYRMTPDDVKYMQSLFGMHDAMDYYCIASVRDSSDYFDKSHGKVSRMMYAPAGVPPEIVVNNEKANEYDLWTSDRCLFDWSVNETALKISLADKDKYNKLAVELSNSMPFFDHYEFRTDTTDEWNKTNNIFNWEIHSGVNRVYARAVNELGIVGPEASAEVLYENS